MVIDVSMIDLALCDLCMKRDLCVQLLVREW